MAKISHVTQQFRTIICCEYSFLNKSSVIIIFYFKGNLAIFSYGTSFGWATVNFVGLQNDNKIFPNGLTLTLQEATLVVSAVFIGNLMCNIAVVPISLRFGIKRTIHWQIVPLIVSKI